MAASKHTHARDNAVTLVWGSLRLAPIIADAAIYGVNVTAKFCQYHQGQSLKNRKLKRGCIPMFN